MVDGTSHEKHKEGQNTASSFQMRGINFRTILSTPGGFDLTSYMMSNDITQHAHVYELSKKPDRVKRRTQKLKSLTLRPTNSISTTLLYVTYIDWEILLYT